MLYFNLLDVNKQKTLSTPARDRKNALEIFGKELGKSLTLDDQGSVASYLIDEWESGPHWINPTIPVFEV